MLTALHSKVRNLISLIEICESENCTNIRKYDEFRTYVMKHNFVYSLCSGGPRFFLQPRYLYVIKISRKKLNCEQPPTPPTLVSKIDNPQLEKFIFFLR